MIHISAINGVFATKEALQHRMVLIQQRLDMI